MTDSSPDFQLGTACHEAGHAVVLHSFGVHVHCVRIEFTDDQWRGGTDASQEAVNGLSDMDQVVTWIAGRAAEEFFKCPSYESAWWDDMKRVLEILSKAGVPEDKHRLLRAEAKKRARGIFKLNHEKVLKLVALLVERRRVERPEFVRLMDQG